MLMMRKRAVAAAVTLGVAGALSVVATGTAHADLAACQSSSSQYGGWQCTNDYAPVWALHSDGTKSVMGYVYAGDNGFGCRTDDPTWGDNGEGSGPHPYRWLFTTPDVVTDSSWGTQGWMSDVDISSDTDPVTGCLPG